MKKLLLIVFLFAGTAYAQSECQTSPEKCVTITREAAIKALENVDKVKALEAYVKTLETAQNDYKAEIAKIRIEYAEKVGENTILKQNEVANRALITVLLQNVKKKRNALITIL